ncbi:MAG: T9SS type A sorting domain-containing protein [Bacteroidota bacterium]
MRKLILLGLLGLLLSSTNAQIPINDIFEESAVTYMAEDCNQNYDYCLPFPIQYLTGLHYRLWLDGDLWRSLSDSCGYDSLYAYNYRQMELQAVPPIHIFSWIIDGQDYQVPAGSLEIVVDSLNNWDPAAHWFINDSTKQIIGHYTGSSYGSLILADAQALSYELPLEVMAGSTISIPMDVGEHILVAEDFDTGETDTLRINIVCELPPFEWPEEDSLIAYCSQTANICLPIPQENLIQSNIQLNGENYSGGLSACMLDTLQSYNPVLLFGGGLSGPYQLEFWMANGQMYSGNFEDILALVDSMNVWDSDGNWSLRNNSDIRGGKPGGTYSAMNIRHIPTSTLSILQPSQVIIPSHYELTLPLGWNELIIVDMIEDYSDTTRVHVDSIGQLIVNYQINNHPGCGASNGSVTLSVQGAPDGEFFYAWSDFDNTQATATNLPAGTYNITVNDANSSCFGLIDFTLIEQMGNAEIIVDSYEHICFDEDDGRIVFELEFDADFIFPSTSMIVDGDGNMAENGWLAAGEYCLLITDGNDCLSAEHCFEIRNEAFEVTSEIQHVTCDTLIGGIILEVTNFANDISYDWADLIGPNDPKNRLFVDVGTYTVVISNDAGCSRSYTFVVEDYCQNPPIVLSNTPLDTAVLCDRVPVPIAPNATTSCPNGLVEVMFEETTTNAICTGSYNLLRRWTFTDDCGGEVVYQQFIIVEDIETPIVLNPPMDTTIDLTIGEEIPDIAEIEVFDNCDTDVEISFVETIDDTGTGQLITRTWTSTDDCGNQQINTQFITVLFGAVWPGDTDSSGVVDLLDLFNIGLGFGQSGPARVDGTIDWIGQVGEFWNRTSPFNQVDYRHSDTDGNGQIEALDLVAIIQNWGLEHEFMPSDVSNSRMDFPITMTLDTVLENGWILIDVALGSASEPIDQIYGLGWTIDYPNDVFEANTVGFSLDDSWLGTPNENIEVLQIDNGMQGELTVGFVGTNQQNRSGWGKIGQFRAKLLSQYIGQPLSLNLINEVGIGIDVEGTSYSTLFEEIPIDIISNSREATRLAQQIHLFPNPAFDHLQVFAEGGIKVESLALFSGIGQLLVYQKNRDTQGLQVPLSDYPSGVYWLRIDMDQGYLYKKVNILKDR